ncbi:hypothetical protein V491_00774 [Pseudogymnoascus sp. VKM F-3775]|nr:hypothetical protein V491_00774 [Pseudogymnoascus sp. VKM F-3775]
MGLSGSKFSPERRHIQASAESGLDASNAIPSSGFTFVENSQGASAAVSELSKSLGTAMEEVDLEGDISQQLKAQMKLLDEKASEYPNSSLEGLTRQTEWTCSQSEAEIISIAWKCAAGAYDPTSNIQFDGLEFKLQNYIPPSIGGTTKATTFILVDKDASHQAPNPFLPVLVIAVRGTASSVDHIVNINSQSKDASCLYDTEYLDEAHAEIKTGIEAHAGFLNSAEVLKGVVSKYIDDYAKQGNVKHILFTGHSAGGAVASLLYLRYLLYPSLRFSSITFGSPPVLRWGLEEQNNLAAEGGLSLNIINEYDLVSRVDRSYVRTLVDLYRSIYDLPPIQGPDFQTTTDDSEKLASNYNRNNGTYWAIPKPVYRHIGKRVVLKFGISPTFDTSGVGQLALTAFSVVTMGSSEAIVLHNLT